MFISEGAWVDTDGIGLTVTRLEPHLFFQHAELVQKLVFTFLHFGHLAVGCQI